MFIRLVLRAPFIAVGAIVMAMLIDLKLSLIFVAAALVIAVLLAIIMLTTMPKYKDVQSKLDDVSRLTKENLSGARVVRAFGAEEREKRIFDDAAQSLSQTSIKVSAVSALLNPLTYSVLNLAVIAILYFGGKSVYMGDLTQGEIIALVNYMTQILNALIVFANLLVTFTKASASAARINEVFDVTSSMQEGSGAIMDESAPAIEMNDVSFAYAQNGEPFLKNVNLTVQKGDSVGILGGTGSGKTTLVSLMSRLYDATSGEVKIYGENVKDYTDAQLRQIFGVAPQKAVLFEGSVKDNLLWANENATDEDIKNALETSQSAEFVNALKEGLNTRISQDGKNLSGGQRQRLTIARALVACPDILVLDDSSSALDFATDAKLRQAIRKMADTMTVFIVSQRTSSIRYADQILVLDEGRLVGVGTHDSLLETCQVYQEIYYSQYSK